MKRKKTKSYIIPQINRILPLITPYFNPLLVPTYLGTSAPRHLVRGKKKILVKPLPAGGQQKIVAPQQTANNLAVAQPKLKLNRKEGNNGLSTPTHCCCLLLLLIALFPMPFPLPGRAIPPFTSSYKMSLKYLSNSIPSPTEIPELSI